MKTTTYQRTIQIATWAVILVFFTLILSGCFWTPDDAKEGGITLLIDKSQLSASQTFEDFNGFFMAYVIADDLMRGDGTAAQQAFDQVDTAWEDAATSGQLENINSAEDLENFRIEVAFPSVQLQAQFLFGTSGSNSFRGLRAGSDYLVVLQSFSFDPVTYEYFEGVGYTIVGIEAGEDKSVSVSLTDNWSAFYQFLEARYGIEPGPAVISVTLPFDYGGGGYYDLLTGNTPTPSNGDYYMTPGASGWYQSAATIVDSAGDILGPTGTRNPIPSDVIELAVAPDKSWRIMIVGWADRTSDAGEVVFLSRPVTSQIGTTVYLSVSDTYGLDFTQFYLGGMTSYLQMYSTIPS